MWGQAPDETVRMVGGGSTLVTSNKNSLFTRIDGPWARGYGRTSLGELRGYQVTGYAVSKKMRAGQEEYEGISLDLDFALKTRQTVVVLGLKPFSTKKEAEDWVFKEPQ
jgi:hypothetical protein